MKARSEMEDTAFADYGHFNGKTILVYEVDGYIGDHHHTVRLDRPLLARVINTERSAHNVIRWTTDTDLDPYYDIELLETSDEVKGLESTWIYGPTYKTDGTSFLTHFVVVDDSILARLNVEGRDSASLKHSTYKISHSGGDIKIRALNSFVIESAFEMAEIEILGCQVVDGDHDFNLPLDAETLHGHLVKTKAPAPAF